MGRLFWPLALVVTFFLGWATAGALRSIPPAAQQVERLQQQVTTLQARLNARESLAAGRQSSEGGVQAGSRTGAGGGPGGTATGILNASLADDRSAGRDATGPGRGSRSAADRPSSQTVPAGKSTPAATIEAALERFYRYLEATSGSAEGRERWRQARELVEELRAMGPAAGQALLQVLAAGNDSDERRAAARLLGSLQIPQAVGPLRDIVLNDDDVLLRRAAASGLRQLQTPEAIPVMERVLANPNEDRFVRLSAASGLADAGRPQGVQGLAQIFDESAADGRGRELAFRALASLNDDRSLPFMRQLAGSDAEPGFRLRAIRFLAAQGDQQSLPTLQVVMHSPTEQPSVRDAAATAYRVLGGK